MTGVEPPNGDVQAEGEASGTRAATDEDGPIFVVHGHDHGRLHELVRVLERTTGREVTVLPEQPNSGRTIVEKFERHAAAAAYAMSHAGIAVDRSRMP